MTAYQLDPTSGQLTALQTVSSLPQDYDGNNSTSDLQIHPNGNFAYLANRGHDTLAAFRIDPESGRLTFIDHFPTEANTRSFAFSNDGQFLYATGSRSGGMATYEVDSNSGRLTPIDSFNVGPSLWWILFIGE